MTNDRIAMKTGPERNTRRLRRERTYMVGLISGGFGGLFMAFDWYIAIPAWTVIGLVGLVIARAVEIDD